MPWGDFEYVCQKRGEREKAKLKERQHLAKLLVDSTRKQQEAALSLLGICNLSDDELQRVGWTGITASIKLVRREFAPEVAEEIIGYYSKKRGETSFGAIERQFGSPPRPKE